MEYLAYAQCVIIVVVLNLALVYVIARTFDIGFLEWFRIYEKLKGPDKEGE